MSVSVLLVDTDQTISLILIYLTMGILDHYVLPANTDGNFKANCRHCPKSISGHMESTGNFNTHMRVCIKCYTGNALGVT